MLAFAEWGLSHIFIIHTRTVYSGAGVVGLTCKSLKRSDVTRSVRASGLTLHRHTITSCCVCCVDDDSCLAAEHLTTAAQHGHWRT